MRSALAGLVVVTATMGWAAAAPAGECATTAYGTGVTLTEATEVGAILAAPDTWAGRTVRVAGTVREVCRKAGCWMEIAPGEGEGEATLRVQVEDGVIVFPLAARGRTAAVEGVVETRRMSAEEHAAWRAHLAEEQGVEPPAGAELGPRLHVALRATGATICL